MGEGAHFDRAYILIPPYADQLYKAGKRKRMRQDQLDIDLVEANCRMY
jgi:hypothetical protein